jgi:hypothetical protein
MRFLCCFCILIYLSAATYLWSQSTQASVFGIVHDASGAVLPGAHLQLHNLDTGRTWQKDADHNGWFQFLEILPARYTVEATIDGFAPSITPVIELGARQQQRVDLTMRISTVQQEVQVEANSTPAIETDSASISASLSQQDVMNLPANFRGGSGTSPLNLIQALPGVQADTASGTSSVTASGTPASNFSVQGGQPFQTEVSVDGISTQSVRSNMPLSDAFPSAESIAEIRVDGVNNNAEYAQAGEITTISKSGTNQLHGSVFWYLQNDALNATPFGSAVKPRQNGNDAGISLSGPLYIPHIYPQKNRTFFMGTYEGFLFPRQTTIQDLVPTSLMQQGDFSAEYPAGELINPATATSYGSNNKIPSINSVAKEFLNFFPSPNHGDYTTLNAAAQDDGYNYVDNRSADYNSQQFDTRVDHIWSDRLQGFTRFTFKNIGLLKPQDLQIGSIKNFDHYRILASSLVYAVTPRLVNELRFGWTSEENGMKNVLNGGSYTTAAGFDNINSDYPVNGITYIYFPNMTSLEAGSTNSTSQSHLLQYSDNLTWTRGKHNFKFGGDLRTLDSVTTLGAYGLDNITVSVFAGLYTSYFDNLPTNSASADAYQFADYLAGVPYETEYYTLVPKNDGRGLSYGLYAQDQWRMTPRLTLSYGVRYEYHPGFHDELGEIGNFDPSVTKTGAVIYPDGHASGLDANFLKTFDACGYGPTETSYAACTPVESNSQAHLPDSLRHAIRDRFLPRIGLAYRPFNDDKTAIRAGLGVYNTTLLGKIFFSMTDTLQAASLTYTNKLGYPPTYTWPETAPDSTSTSVTYGTASFSTANQIHWIDPYSMQWNLSVDHQFPSELGVRVSYIGMRSLHLVRGANQNDMSYSTTEAKSRPLTDRPFPNWGTVDDRMTDGVANLHSFQIEANRHIRNGFSLQSTYTFSKNLADNQGTRATTFASENGGNVSADSSYGVDPRLDYGNVYGTRRHRWITTSVYDLPFGKGNRLGANWSKKLSVIAGGWQLSNILLLQTGPFLTAYIPSGDADPSGTGAGVLFGRDQRPDLVGNPVPSNRSRSQWFNPQAFACPSNTGYTSSSYAGNTCTVGVTSNPIGRFGTERLGSLIGPGTINWSAGLRKRIDLSSNYHLMLDGSFTNLLNHTNLGDPTMDVTSASFGKITSSRGSDFGGSRTGQVAVRLEF